MQTPGHDLISKGRVMIQFNNPVKRRRHQPAELVAGKLPEIDVRVTMKARDRGSFVRLRMVLATIALLLVAGCQQKQVANDVSDHNTPAAEADNTASQQKQAANVAADDRKPTVETDESLQTEKKSKTDDSTATGKRVFASCARCHQSDGQGVPEKYPPLDGNPVVNGRADIVARIVLIGLHGPVEVNGNTFDGKMPSWSRFDDGSLAAVITYIRKNWSNDSPPVSEELVASVRKAVGGRTEAWTMTELKSAPLIEVGE